MNEERLNSGNIVDTQVLRRILQFVNPYKRHFFVVIVLTLLLSVLVPVRPLLIQYTLDNHVANGDYIGMVRVMGLVFILLLIYSGLQYFHTLLANWIGHHVVRDIRVKLYSHLIQFKLPFFDKTPVGRLVTRTISDVESLADVFSEGLASLIAELLQILFILLFMILIDWRLALVSLLTFPFMIMSSYIFKEKIKITFNDVRNAISNLNSFVQEHLIGMSVVQIFGNENREFQKFKKFNREHRAAHLKSVFYYSVYFPVAEIISALSISLLVWYGTKSIINPDVDITIGTVTAFIMYIQMFFRPIRMIVDRYNTLQMGVVSSSRIITLLDSELSVRDNGKNSLENIQGKVEFSHVWFAYNDAEYVLKNINFLISPGKTIALVGSTGAGKSSIINLLNRFYEINRGTIKIDDVEIQHVTLPALRQHVGIVLQDVFLFNDTVRNNISLGNPAITDSMIMKAATLTGASKFINQMPGGLDFNVGERGMTLSIGQRQLLSFIRAMVYDPKILILDEATSSIDQETEYLIQQAIKKMMINRTSIIIAHRLVTIQHVDAIIVIEKGEIKEIGSHETLLKKNGYYAHLYKVQYKETRFLSQGNA